MGYQWLADNHDIFKQNPINVLELPNIRILDSLNKARMIDLHWELLQGIQTVSTQAIVWSQEINLQQSGIVNDGK